MDETAAVRECFPDLVRHNNIRSILDIPCGDFAWMKHTSLELDHYIGADIVSAIVSNNLAQFKREHHPVRDFQLLDLTRDVLPCADAVLCRDCLVHFSNEDIFKALIRIQKSDSTFLLTTSFREQQHNKDIVTGWWRPLNLELAPFNFPEPLEVIDERCQLRRGAYPDKSLGLWRIADLPEFGSDKIADYQGSSEVERK